jgi:hypothetical protein
VCSQELLFRMGCCSKCHLQLHQAAQKHAACLRCRTQSGKLGCAQPAVVTGIFVACWCTVPCPGSHGCPWAPQQQRRLQCDALP